MSGYRNSEIKGLLLKIIGGAYFLQLFIVMPWFLGAIYRHEQPMWVWQAFLKESHKAGLGDVLFVGYLYLIFYSGLLLIPICLVSIWCVLQAHEYTKFPQKECLMMSAWIGATFFLFPDSIMEFIRHLPWGGPSEWLIILWVAGGLFVAYSFSQLHRKTPN
jgi:hypothetical protein